MLRLARATLAEVTDRIREAAVELVGGRYDDDTVRTALNRLADEHPDDDTIVGLAQVTLAETTEFVRDHDLVSLVDDPCVIEEMPEFARGVAVAYCDSPGPLETAPLPTFYCIAPAPSDWSPERVGPRSTASTTTTWCATSPCTRRCPATSCSWPTPAATPARPGSGRWPGPSPFVEGWAVYAERDDGRARLRRPADPVAACSRCSSA